MRYMRHFGYDIFGWANCVGMCFLFFFFKEKNSIRNTRGRCTLQMVCLSQHNWIHIVDFGSFYVVLHIKSIYIFYFITRMPNIFTNDILIKKKKYSTQYIGHSGIWFEVCACGIILKIFLAFNYNYLNDSNLKRFIKNMRRGKCTVHTEQSKTEITKTKVYFCEFLLVKSVCNWCDLVESQYRYIWIYDLV